MFLNLLCVLCSFFTLLGCICNWTFSHNHQPFQLGPCLCSLVLPSLNSNNIYLLCSCISLSSEADFLLLHAADFVFLKIFLNIVGRRKQTLFFFTFVMLHVFLGYALVCEIPKSVLFKVEMKAAAEMTSFTHPETKHCFKIAQVHSDWMESKVNLTHEYHLI